MRCDYLILICLGWLWQGCADCDVTTCFIELFLFVGESFIDYITDYLNLLDLKTAFSPVVLWSSCLWYDLWSSCHSNVTLSFDRFFNALEVRERAQGPSCFRWCRWAYRTLEESSLRE